MERSRNRRENPSFSSTLLDSIYRSIDESNEKPEKDLFVSRETARKKQGNFKEEQNRANFQRVSMIDQWMMERKLSEKIIICRKNSPNFDKKSRDSVLLNSNSSSSSSDSSFGCGISSNELYSIYGERPKPIRTSISVQPPEKFKFDRRSNSQESQISNHENRFMKTKSKALKIYGDLKKVKQPISPGGKLANFLNSIFTNGNTKKSKSLSTSKSANESTCSSVSSFSRSCLSKTPSSRGNLSNGIKRSVRFVDDHESRLMSVTTIKSSINDEARDLLKSYQKRISDFSIKDEDNDDDDEDDDVLSCSSSDLFELDNLSAVGIDRYREELPVYETTHFDTNYAIANGLIM